MQLRNDKKMNLIKTVQKFIQLPKTERGFSFIELIVSIVILSTALVSFLGVFSNSLANTVTQQSSIRVAGVAREKMESLLSDRFANGFDTITEANYPSETLSSPYNGYTVATEITFVDESDLETEVVSSDYKKIVVTISHNTNLFSPLSFSTVVSNYGE